NTVRRQGNWGIVTTQFPWLTPATTPGDNCQGGLPVGTACFFDTFDNVVAGNALSANGAFGNPTNGNRADVSHKHFFGVLDAHGLCAKGYRDACDGTVAPALLKLAQLAAAVHATLAPMRASAPARYPQQTTVSAPRPPMQPSLPNPCATVPANP